MGRVAVGAEVVAGLVVLVGGWIVVALSVAVVVWLVYFVIEVARTLNVWPA